MRFRSTRLPHTVIIGSLAVGACALDSPDPTEPVEASSLRAQRVECAPDNGGITLPEGFCAVVVADLTMDGEPARARHLAVTPSGDIFVAINSPRNNQPQFGIIGLRDTDGDGRADEQVEFSPGLGGSGIAWGQGRLYFGANDRVVRFKLPAGQLMPSGPAETVVSGLTDAGDHISKTVVLANPHTLFVNIGSASNSCQEANRQPQSPGVFPCPELPERAGVWQFDARGTNQTQADGEHYATGLRNMVALAIHPRTGDLFGVQHGRDMLFENWPQFYTVEEDAVLPAEELVRITQGSDNGWPYCYYDAEFENAKVLAPEYGGDGAMISGGPGIDCASYNQPLVTFGAHWAPNGLHFYRGTQFPARYRNGAFVAFHGGFDRAPLPNEGYRVTFVPFSAGGTPTGPQETFADGFAGSDGPLPQTAVHRPVGVTEGPDGSLYVSDDRGGRIWRIIHRGR
jgi:glucose/arabinose dehydrogenase